jgi:8-oxo-dGTP diphosphatase
MDIAALTAEMNRFVEGQGWYRADSPKPQTPRSLAISLVLEAAEVLELFQWSDRLPATEDLSLELADVALYLLQLSSVSGIDLEQAVLRKLSINNERAR